MVDGWLFFFGGHETASKNGGKKEVEGKQGIPVTKTEICASEEEYVEKRDEVGVGGDVRKKLKKQSEEVEHQLLEQV